jgi:hypothetical protein
MYKQECPLLLLPFNIVLEVVARVIRQEKEIKGIQIGKEEVSYICIDDMISYMQNSRESIKNLLEQINMFCKVAGYEINIKVALLYTYNEQSEMK